jgi:hypothetical protein
MQFSPNYLITMSAHIAELNSELLSDLPMPCFSILMLSSTLSIVSKFGVFSVPVQSFQPAANMRARSLFRDHHSIRRRFPDLEMLHQHRLPAESQAR